MNLQNNKDDLIKEIILKSARELFQKWGMSKTTMEDIAKASGKGKSTLYYYYKSKEEIYEAVALNEMREIHKIVIDTINREPTAEGKLKAYVMTSLIEAHKRITVYDVVKQEIAANDHIIRKIRTIYDSQEVRIVYDILAFGIRNDEFNLFNEKELNLLSYMIVTSLRSIEINLFLEDNIFTEGDKLEAFTNILTKGLKK